MPRRSRTVCISICGPLIKGGVNRLVGLGASRVNIGQPDDVSWVVMADPEGNEFCVLAPLSLASPAGAKGPHHEAVPSATAAPRKAESFPWAR